MVIYTCLRGIVTRVSSPIVEFRRFRAGGDMVDGLFVEESPVRAVSYAGTLQSIRRAVPR